MWIVISFRGGGANFNRQLWNTQISIFSDILPNHSWQSTNIEYVFIFAHNNTKIDLLMIDYDSYVDLSLFLGS